MAQFSNTHRPDVSFVWNILDNVLRDTFLRSELGDVLLPFIVLRRLDCILEPVNEAVRAQYNALKDVVSDDKLAPALKAVAGQQFYNTSRYTLTTLLDDADNIAINFRLYINNFNAEVVEIFNCYQFEKVVARLNRRGLLYKMVSEVVKLDFRPEKVDNHDMGYYFEEILRIANDESNQQAGEHFTPRDVIRLMSAILFTPDKERLRQPGIIRTIYDPTCGTGGMVNIGKRYILEEVCGDMDTKPEIVTYGQEINEQTYAIAKSEALVSGENADNIKLGNTLTEDLFASKRFHYIMANPPYGSSWKKDQAFVIEESMNPNARFSAGTPRSSDGQLLFVQHMLSKMDPDKGSRVGIVTNGSPLFSGGAGSGESNIRGWILNNDWLEAIIALPSDLFYNTGIATYIWVLTNRKEEKRRGKVQLINAVSFCKPSTKSMGNKRNDILDEHVKAVLDIYTAFKEGEYSKIMANSDFGRYELTIEQPQRDDDGKIVNRSGKPVADASKRDTERVPLDCNIKEYFAKEVLPNVDPGAWIDRLKTRTHYEINFNRYFYKYTPLEASDSIAERITERQNNLITMFNNLFH